MHGTNPEASAGQPDIIGGQLPVGSSEIHFSEKSIITVKRQEEDSVVEIVMSFPWQEFSYDELLVGLEEAVRVLRDSPCGWEFSGEGPFKV